jgi:hypothetical protein
MKNPKTAAAKQTKRLQRINDLENERRIIKISAHAATVDKIYRARIASRIAAVEKRYKRLIQRSWRSSERRYYNEERKDRIKLLKACLPHEPRTEKQK